MIATLSLDSHIRVSPEQVSCDLGGETVILNLKDSIYYGLDGVGASIWALIQQPCTIGAVRVALLREFDVDADRCERDVLALIEKLVERGLVEVEDAAG